MMTRYRNLDGNSGVSYYESGPDFIRLKFLGGSTYVYDYGKPGLIHVERMKALASVGRGLSAYISRYVQDGYARREK